MNLRTVLESVGLPLERGIAPRDNPPYLVYIETSPGIFAADGLAYHMEKSYRLEYYWTKKNSTIEEDIEGALYLADVFFTKSEDIYIPEEEVWVTFYYL